MVTLINKTVLHHWLQALLRVTVSLVILVPAFTASGHIRQGAVHVQDWRLELQEDLARLDSFRSSQDLDALEAVINRQSVKWQKRSRQLFVEYMLRACGLLSSYRLGDQ